MDATARHNDTIMAMDSNHSQEMYTDDVEMSIVKEEETTWNPQACMNPQWSTTDRIDHREATRLQDLKLEGLVGSDSTHQPKSEPDKGNSSTWPFESSPCRWHGGRNTRPSAAHNAMNQALFDPDFAHKATFDQGSMQRSKNARDSMEIEGENHKIKYTSNAKSASRSFSEGDDDPSGSSDIDSETSTEFANDDDDDDEEVEREDDSSTGSFCDDGGRESTGAAYVVPVMAQRTSSDAAVSYASTSEARRPASGRDVQGDREKVRGPTGSSSRSRRTCDDKKSSIESQPPPSTRASSHRVSRSSHGGTKAIRQHPARSQLKQDDYMDNRRRSSPTKEHYNTMLAYYNPESGQFGSTSEKSQALKGDNSSGSRRRGGSSGHGDQTSSQASDTRNRDELSASCHGQVERKSSSSAGIRSSSSRRRAADELSSATFHGPVSQSRAGPSPSLSSSLQGKANLGDRSSTTSRIPPARTRSSDGAELGAATLHGGSSISRIRSGKRRPPSSSSDTKSSAVRDLGTNNSNGSKTRPIKPGERRMLQRAMSIRNVKRPEEYATVQGVATKTVLGNSATEPDPPVNAMKQRESIECAGNPSSEFSGGSSCQGTRSALSQRTSSVRNLASSSTRTNKTSTRRTNEDATSDVAMEDSAPTSDHLKSSTRSTSSRTAPHRATSLQQHQHQPLPRSNSSDSTSNVITPGSISSMSTASSSGNRRRTGVVSTPTAATSGEPTSRPRDILLLLRDRKKVTQLDLLDKENRRLLHYLMMEHKMGVSQKELYQVVRADAATAGAESAA